MGLLAGAAVAVALAASAPSRALAGLVLGGVTLPALAAHLGALGARSDAAFAAYSASSWGVSWSATVVVGQRSKGASGAHRWLVGAATPQSR